MGLYSFLSLYDKPYEYGIFAPIIVILFTAYYVIFYMCMYKLDSYTDVINEILDDFEKTNKCKIRIRKRRKKFEINWNPSLLKLAKKKRTKAKAKGSKVLPYNKSSDKDSEEIDLDNKSKDTEMSESSKGGEKMNKLNIGKSKPSILKNKSQVKPLKKIRRNKK